MQRLWYSRWASLRSSAGASLLLSYILTYQKRRKTHEEIVSSTNQETISGPSSRRSLMSQTVSPHEISPATANIADIVELFRQRAAHTPAGQWIRTSNAWHESNLAEGRLPTAPELDQASQDHPIWVKRGGHVGVANSLALHIAGITRETPNPPGGIIKHFPDRTLTGEL